MDPVQTSAPTPKPATQPAAPAEKQFRQNNGQFSPKHPVQDSQREESTAPKATKPAGPGGSREVSGEGTAGQLNARAEGEAPPEETPAETKAEKERRKYKLKVDGQEIEAELDDDDIVRELQLARAAQKRMREAAQVRQESQRLTAALKAGDLAALAEQGLDVAPLVERHLLEQAQRALLTPEQIRVQELERENAKLKESTEKEAAKAKEAAQQQADELTWRELEPKLLTAAQEFDLPRDPKTMELLASVGLEFLDAGVALEPRQVAAEVAKRQGARTQRYVVKHLQSLPPEAAVAWLRQAGVLEHVVKGLDAEYRKGTGQPPAPPKESAPTTPDEDEGPILSTADWNRRMQRRR